MSDTTRSEPNGKLTDAGDPAASESQHAPTRSSDDVPERTEWVTGWLFTLPYVVLLMLFGVAPFVYAFLLMFAEFNQGQPDYFAAGLENFRTAFTDFRIREAVGNLIRFLLLSVTLGVLLVTVLALLLHMKQSRTSSALRTLYFMPGAVAGVPAVLLAIFMFDPRLSPFAPLFDLMGQEQVIDVLTDRNYPLLFMIIGFFTGAGAWIAIFYGGLNAIPEELLEAAVVDGASPWQLAWHLKRPLLKPYIVYMLVLVFANNVQLFAEPQIFLSANLAPINPTWSPNQIAFSFAFQLGLFGVAAVLALAMLLVGLLAAAIVLRFTDLFQTS